MFGLLYLNANTLINKIEELKLVIEQFIVEVIDVTEVLPKYNSFQVQEAELLIKGFSILTNFDKAYLSRGRGVMLYVKNGLCVINGETNSPFQEHLFMYIVFPNGKTVAGGLLYRSPSSTNENNTDLLNLLGIMSSHNKNNNSLIILGDFNLPKVEWYSLRRHITVLMSSS